MAKNTTAEIFAPVAATKAPRRRTAKKTAVAAAVAAAVTAAPAPVPAVAAAPASPAPAIIQAAAPAPVPAVAAAGLTWAKCAHREKDQGTNLYSFRHGIEFNAIDGKIRFVKAQLAFSMDDLKALFGLNYAKYIKTNLLSYAARFISESGPTRNYVWLYSDILRFAGSTKNRKTIKQAVRNYYNQING